MGMHLMLEIGTQSVYKNVLPDFMVWNQVKELPLFWRPFYSGPFTLLAVVAVPAAVAFIFGYLTFRSRIRGVYFSIITQALALCAWLLFNRNYAEPRRHQWPVGLQDRLRLHAERRGHPARRSTWPRRCASAAPTCCAAPSRGRPRARCWWPSGTARRACSSPGTRRPPSSSSSSSSRRCSPAWRARSTCRRSASSRRPRSACCRPSR